MNMLILPILYILSGFFMKISDDFYDEKHNKTLAIILGIVCGIATALASLINFDAFCIFISILIGNIIALKVDGVHHIATMLTFFIILIIGIVFFIPITAVFTLTTLIVLIVCILGAFLDELGNDNEKIYALGKPFEIFFDYRCAMKVAILILVVLGFMNFWSFIFFLCFEISYECGRILFNKFIL